MFEAFGTIKYCRLASSQYPGRHKGYGFIEYETDQAAVDAITSMNLFDLGGQYLRVGRAITPPNCLDGPAAPSSMPTAAAVAAAAATAKIQAMEASGLSTAATNGAAAVGPPGLAMPTPVGLTTQNQTPGLLPASGVQPVLAANAPGVITGVTVTPPPGQPAAVPIAPPQLLSTLPVTLLPSQAKGSPTVNNTANAAKPMTALEQAAAIAAQKEKELKDGNEEPQSLQQQENIVIKGSSARHMLMQKLMRKNEVRG